jgi:hypothetical protein
MRFQSELPDAECGQEADAALEQALKNFRSSVHAWSDAVYTQGRPVAAARSVSWRLAVGWALGCVLAAGSLSGGIYERHQRQQAAKMAAAAQAARQQKLAAAVRTRTQDEDLLAKVDSDVSREVPSAMEPLAQLMSENDTQ